MSSRWNASRDSEEGKIARTRPDGSVRPESSIARAIRCIDDRVDPLTIATRVVETLEHDGDGGVAGNMLALLQHSRGGGALNGLAR